MEEIIRCLKGGGDLRRLALNVLGFVISREGELSRCLLAAGWD